MDWLTREDTDGDNPPPGTGGTGTLHPASVLSGGRRAAFAIRHISSDLRDIDDSSRSFLRYLPAGLVFDATTATIVGTPLATPPVFVSPLSGAVEYSKSNSSTWRVVISATDSTGAVVPVVDVLDIELAGVLDMFRAVYAASNAPVDFANDADDSAYAGREYLRDAPEDDVPDDGNGGTPVHQPLKLLNSVGKLFYNVQCPICDAKNQSYAWLIAQQEGTGVGYRTSGGALKGTPPADLAGTVYEGIQVVVQDEEHPRIILSNFTLAVTQAPFRAGEWAAIALAIVLVPLLLLLAVQKCRQYIEEHRTIDFTEALATLRREGAIKPDPEHPEQELQTPDELKRSQVKVLEVLGAGAFGEVRKGLYTGAKAPYTVAVKMSTKLGGDDELVAEMALMAQFQHNHVLSLVGAVTAGKPILLVMQHCEYGSLKDYLIKHDGFLSLTVEAQLKVCLDVCKGMTYVK